MVSPLAASEGYLQLNVARTSLSGDLSTTGDRGNTFAVDLEKDIGFDDAFTFDGRTGVVIGILRVGVGGAIFNHSAKRSLSGFDFSGARFDAEGELESRLRWVEGELGIAPIPFHRARLELIGGVRWFDWEGTARGRATVNGSVFEAEEKETASGPVPHVGAALELRPAERFVLRGQARGFFLGINAGEGHELDIEVTAGFRVHPKVELGGGYRHLEVFISADDKDTVLHYKYEGIQGYVRFGF